MLEKQVRTMWTCKKPEIDDIAIVGPAGSAENFLHGKIGYKDYVWYLIFFYLIGFNASSPTRNYLDTETDLIAILRLYMNLLKSIFGYQKAFFAHYNFQRSEI